MHFSVPPRTARLAPFVSALGYYESALPAGRDRVLPGGGTDLMVNLHEDEFRTYHGPGATAVRRAPGAVLIGAEEHAVVIDTADQRRGLSVSLPAAGGPRRKLAVLKKVLLRYLAAPPPHQPAMGHAAAELTRGRKVGETGAELGLSPRTFTRRFRDHTGLTPNRFARIQRLQRLLAAVEPGRTADWARLAAEHGYCDQAHLIDDFRELTGVTPGAYRPRSAAERNHLPV